MYERVRSLNKLVSELRGSRDYVREIVKILTVAAAKDLRLYNVQEELKVNYHLITRVFSANQLEFIRWSDQLSVHIPKFLAIYG